MGEPTIRNVQASYGKELLNTAIIAGIVSIVLLLVYVAVRFRTLGYAAAFSDDGRAGQADALGRRGPALRKTSAGAGR